MFGPGSSPPPAGVDDEMDISDTAPEVDELSPPPPKANSSYLPPHHHSIPENDFQPDINPDDLYPPEPYNEGLENLALEDELSDFANIRYGWLSILNLPYIEVLTVYHRWKYL